MSDAVKQDLLARLKRLGPLPEDAALTQAQLDELGEIFDVLSRSGTAPDADYVRPLLATFGYGDGFGLYTHGVWALLKQDPGAVVSAALDALELSGDGPRLWALETLRRMREGGDSAPPTPREVRLVEQAMTGPPLVAYAAVSWAYWLGGAEGRRLLELGAGSATGEARERAAELLAEQRED